MTSSENFNLCKELIDAFTDAIPLNKKYEMHDNFIKAYRFIPFAHFNKSYLKFIVLNKLLSTTYANNFLRIPVKEIHLLMDLKFVEYRKIYKEVKRKLQFVSIQNKKQFNYIQYLMDNLYNTY